MLPGLWTPTVSDPAAVPVVPDRTGCAGASGDVSEADRPTDPHDPDDTDRFRCRLSEAEVRALATGVVPEHLQAYFAECVLWFDGRLQEALAALRRKRA